MDILELLNKTASKGASDLLLVAGTPPIVRIGGKLSPLEEITLSAENISQLLLPLLNKKQKNVFEEEKDLDFCVEIQNRVRFRVNIHCQKSTIAAAFRTVLSEIPTVESLRIPKIVYEFVNEPRGLILVTGATGAGKTTTQAAMINIINNTKNSHIITIEDPIEFVHENKKSIIEQREIGVDSPSFPSALMYVLRQNPDVILIGEMRELETISTAITAAETGHLVISTLHTNDSVQTIDRIIDVFPPHQQNQVRMQLSLTLQGVICQQLVSRSDGQGLVLAAEVMKVTPGIRNIIRKGNAQDIYSMIEIGSKYGMQTMNSALKKLYEEKIIAYETAIGRAVNPENLEKMLLGK